MAEIVATLLSHYWTGHDDPELRRIQGRDWVEDLREFPVSSVRSACQEWRRTQSRKPTIADIRSLCREASPRNDKSETQALPDLRAMDDDKLRQKREYEEAYQWRLNWARERGCVDFHQAMQIGLVAVGRRNPADFVKEIPIEDLAPKADEILPRMPYAD